MIMIIEFSCVLEEDIQISLEKQQTINFVISGTQKRTNSEQSSFFFIVLFPCYNSLLVICFQLLVVLEVT